MRDADRNVAPQRELVLESESVDFVLNVRVRRGSFPIIEKARIDVGNANNSIEMIICIDNGMNGRSYMKIHDDEAFLFIVLLWFFIIIIVLSCIRWFLFSK